MAKVKNVSGEDRTVPALGHRLVTAGASVDVEAEQVYGFTCQEALWAPADAEAKKAHKAATEPASENEETEES